MADIERLNGIRNRKAKRECKKLISGRLESQREPFF